MVVDDCRSPVITGVEGPCEVRAAGVDLVVVALLLHGGYSGRGGEIFPMDGWAKVGCYARVWVGVVVPQRC